MNEYTCDWPKFGGSACGERAQWFFEVDRVHRPICDDCTALAARVAEEADKAIEFLPIDAVDPDRVPQKIPTQAERRALGLEGEIPPGIETPPGIEVPPAPPTTPSDPAPSFRPSRPPLREALEDLAVSVLLVAREKVEQFRRGR